MYSCTIVFTSLLIATAIIGAIVVVANPPAVDEPTPLQRNEISKQSRNYTFGSRVVGDELVAVASGGVIFEQERNAQLIVEWPDSGRKDYVLTYFRTWTNLSTSFLGSMQVVEGNRNRAYVRFVLQANSTELFEWKYEIFALKV